MPLNPDQTNELNDTADWLRLNPGAKGEPEYVQRADTYRTLRKQQLSEQQEGGGAMSWVRNRLFNEGRAPGEAPPAMDPNVPDIATARRQYDPDPYSVNNTIDRIGV